MAESKKVWNKHKITAIIIMLIAIAVVFSMYMEWEYPAINHPKSLERPISNYINKYGLEADIQAKVVQIEKHDKYLFATFTDEKYSNFMGMARFQRGYDHLWHLVGISYGNELSVATHYYYSDNYISDEANNLRYPDKISTLIYGINVDPGITYYEGHGIKMDFYGGTQSDIKYFNKNITSADFIDYYEGEFFFYELGLFDKNGNNITLELKTEADDSGPWGWGSTAWNRTGNWLIYFIALLFAYIIARIFWAGNPNPIRYSEIKEDRKEGKSGGFVNRLKNIDINKKIAIVIVAVTFMIIISVCLTSFSAYYPESDLTEAIENYTGDSNITILKTETGPDEKFLVALYITEKSYNSSIVIFERGWNGLWAPFDYYKTINICITSFPFSFGNNHYFIVKGVDCDPRAASYAYVFEYSDIERDPVIDYGSNITEPNFIHIYKMGRYHLFAPKIYDSVGNNIEPELTEKFNEDTVGWDKTHGHVSTTGRDNTKSVVLNIIIVCFFLAWFFWIKIPKKEDE